MARAKKETVAEVASEEVKKDPIQLTLQDLTLAANIINIVTTRGAIKAEEMSVVGGLYDKLAAFLAENGVARTPAPAEGDAPAA